MKALTNEVDSDNDYTLNDESVWITVKGFSVYIKKTDEGVVIDIYKKNDELTNSVASTYAFDSEVE